MDFQSSIIMLLKFYVWCVSVQLLSSNLCVLAGKMDCIHYVKRANKLTSVKKKTNKHFIGQLNGSLSGVYAMALIYKTEGRSNAKICMHAKV